jgi:hypothetical protein
MQTDPAEEWRRLAEEYRGKSDLELRELAADIDDLTETAKQALRQEMQSRGLGDPQAKAVSNTSNRDAEWAPVRMEAADIGAAAGPTAIFGHTPETVADSEDGQPDDSDPHDYTWLTYLCECETKEQARQLCEVLRQAKIDCAYKTYGLAYPQVEVAADQLEQARAIAAQPIPQEIIDDSKVEVPDFEVPKCPKCGAEDPVLEAVEPANRWHCEQCDAEWSDPVEAGDDKTSAPAQPAP